jgi:hypothetical protein
LPMHLRYRLYILPFYLRFFPLWQPHTPFFVIDCFGVKNASEVFQRRFRQRVLKSC